MAARGTTGDLYEQLDPAGQQLHGRGDSWTRDSHLTPGLYLSDPQGHALLVGTNGRSMTLLDLGPRIADVGSVLVESPEVLEQLADRLKFMADRMRQRAERSAVADRRLVEATRNGSEDSWWEADR